MLAQNGIEINGQGPADIQIHDERLYQRLLFHPVLGAGEAYMERWWDCKQLDELFFRICRNEFEYKIYNKAYMAFTGLLNRLINWQSQVRSKQVAERHYNLGNEFYRRMLGETMAYSCGYWKNAKDLDQAQYDKFDLICRKLYLKPGDRVLDIGCGWGTLAKFMAEKYGCEVVGVNISTEQVRFAQENCKNLPVTYCLADYRNSHLYNPRQIPFDKVVSVGFCEHIGHKNYVKFFEVVRQNISDTGLFLLHTIGKNDSSNLINPWIHKYIFPNGVLPSIKLLGGAIENHFVLEDLHNFGTDYDKTLMAWHKNFNDAWHASKQEKDEKFFRMWNYYLLSCAGGFRACTMMLWQFVLSPKGILKGYHSVR